MWESMTYTARSAPTLLIATIAPTTGLAVATCHTVRIEVWLVLVLSRSMTVEYGPFRLMMREMKI